MIIFCRFDNQSIVEGIRIWRSILPSLKALPCVSAAICVAIVHPGCCDLVRLANHSELPSVYNIFALGAVEALKIGVPRRFDGLDMK